MPSACSGYCTASAPSMEIYSPLRPSITGPGHPRLRHLQRLACVSLGLPRYRPHFKEEMGNTSDRATDSEMRWIRGRLQGCGRQPRAWPSTQARG
eukprot:gene16684-biopygen8454